MSEFVIQLAKLKSRQEFIYKFLLINDCIESSFLGRLTDQQALFMSHLIDYIIENGIIDSRAKQNRFKEYCVENGVVKNANVFNTVRSSLSTDSDKNKESKKWINSWVNERGQKLLFYVDPALVKKFSSTQMINLKMAYEAEKPAVS